MNAGDGVSYEEFARAALDLSGQAATDLETVEMDSLSLPHVRCLLLFPYLMNAAGFEV